MIGKDPFGYDISMYLWVIGIACIGGLVKHLNVIRDQSKEFSFWKFFIDLATAGFMGVLTFWVCESIPVKGPLSAILIATGGMMGNTAIKEFENFWRAKFGLKHAPPTDQNEVIE